MRSSENGQDRYAGAPDASLVKAACAQDVRAFGELVRRNETRVYRFILRRLGLAAQSEELAQEAFLRAWKRLPGFRGDSLFSTWLTGIALNVVREHRLRVQRESNEVEWSEPAGEPNAREHGPARSAERAAMLRATQDAIDALPDELRETFIMNALDDLGYEEIAVLLDVPIGTVKSRISRARARVRAALKDHDLAALTSQVDGP